MNESNLVDLVHNQITILATTMKSNSNWFNYSPVPSPLSNLANDLGMKRFPKSNTSDNLMSSLYSLRSRLPANKTLDPLEIFNPFLEIISSPDTSGPITLASLQSVEKFLSTDLLTTSSPNSSSTLSSLSNAITHCTFEPSDNLTDEAVLSRILDIIRIVLTSHLNSLCSDRAVCALIETGLSMCCQMRLSPTLRNSAERTMQSVVRALVISYKSRYQHKDTIDNLNSPLHVPQIDPVAAKVEKENLKTTDKPFGDATMSEVVRVLVKLLDPHDTKYTDTIRLAALRILDVALTTAGATLSKIESIRSILSDQGCKYLFQLARVEASPLLIMTMRVITVLFDTCKSHLKLQQELFLSFLVERLSPSTSANIDIQPFDPYYTWEASIMPSQESNGDEDEKLNTSGSATPSLAPAKAAKPAYGATRQLLLETLVYFIHRPNFLSELWLNYDSDIDCDDLFERVMSFIVEGIFPQENSTLDSQLLCLDAVLSFIAQMHDTIANTTTSAPLQYPSSIALTKSRKKVILTGARKFNTKPKLGLEYLTRHGVVDVHVENDTWTKDTCDSVAKFLKQCARLDKRLLGDYISRPENLEVLKSFMSLFDFKGRSVADSMRQVLETFRLPGESQQINRITEVFAEHYFSFAPAGILSQDAVYVLAYSVIMLNTDLHNPQNRARRMTDSAYKRNLRGVNDGKDFDQAMLDEVYNSIRKREIVMPEEHHDQVGFDYAWKEMLFRSKTAGIVKEADSADLVKPIYETSLRKLLVGLSYAFASFDDSVAIKKVMDAYAHIVYLAKRLDIPQIPDLAFVSLRRSTGVFIPRFQENEFAQAKVVVGKGDAKEEKSLSVTSHTVQFGVDLKAQLAAWTIFNTVLQELSHVEQSWEDVFDILVTLFHNDLLPDSIQSMEDFLGGSTPIPKEAVSGDRESMSPNSGSNSNSTSLLSTLSSYLLSPYSNENHMTQATEEDVEATLKAIDAISLCNLEALYKGLWSLPKDNHAAALMAIKRMLEKRTTDKLAGLQYNRKGTPPIIVPYDRQSVFLLELLISMSVRNAGAIEHTWTIVFPLLEKILSFSNVFSTLLTERAAVGLSKLTLQISEKMELHEELFIAIDLLRSLPQQQLLASISDHLLTLVESVIDAKVVLQNSTEWHLIIALLQSSSNGNSGSATERVMSILHKIVKHHLSTDSLSAVLSILTTYSLSENTEALELLVSFRTVSIEGVSSNSDMEWEVKMVPLSLKLSEICLHHSKHVRQKAIEGLSSILLENPRNDLAIFRKITFPLLENLLRPDVYKKDPTVSGMISTRSSVTNLVCKMWLLVDLTTLDQTQVEEVWLDLLDFLDRFMSSSTNSKNQNMVHESILENLKNLVLVMNANGIISADGSNAQAYQLYLKTVERTDLFLQGFVGEVLKDTEEPSGTQNDAPNETQTQTQPQDSPQAAQTAVESV